jgi:ferredoxin-NADP reductase
MSDQSIQTHKLSWRTARIESVVTRTPTVKSFFFRFDEPLRFVAGQHMDVRLTSDDGYQAQRSYSIASAPENAECIELAIEKLADGEVSPFFHDVATSGDEIELRGPIGGHFLWRAEDGGPVLLVGGGSGVVPLACMVRHRAARDAAVPMALVHSARAPADLIFGDELRLLSDRNDGFRYFATLTRALGPGIASGRISAPLLQEALSALRSTPATTYVCGSNAFVEAATELLIELGIAPGVIRTERYG